MFLKTDLNETYTNEFEKLGIADEDDMLNILNCLDEIAEIGYVLYNKKKTNNHNYDQEKETNK